MPANRACLFSVFTLFLVSRLPIAGQSVISVRSGVVHYFEGSVSIGEHPLQHQAAKFPSIADGEQLRTAQGRAEVLLTPGAILRVGENSAIRMLYSELSDRLELQNGSAILESMQQYPGNSVTLIYKNWQVRVPRQGVYKIDSEPQQLKVYTGSAEVSAVGAEAALTVRGGETLPLATVLVPDRTTNESADAFTDWAMGRSHVVSAENATAAQIVDDPNLFDASATQSGSGLGGFTYFPPVGLSSLRMGLSNVYGWNSWGYPYSSNLYTPGYIYVPLISAWPVRGRYPVSPPVGIPPHSGTGGSHVVTPPPVHISPPHAPIRAPVGHR
jgi:hypothetical protein